MDQRVAFIADWLRDEWTMTELADAVCTSVARPPTNGSIGTRRTRRTGLADRSRAPKVHGRAMADGDPRARSWRCGAAHPHWGPKKLRADLAGAAAARSLAGARARWAICCGGKG